jgi:hypothetical protein
MFIKRIFAYLTEIFFPSIRLNFRYFRFKKEKIRNEKETLN